MKKFKKVVSFSAVLSAVPFLAFAVDAQDIIIRLGTLLNNIIPVLITLAVVYFIWGVIQYTISTDEEAKKGARGKIIQGLIGLFLIIAFWGIVNLVQNTFGVGATKLDVNDIPCIPVNGQTSC